MPGRIDRLIVAADRVLAVDFKTNGVVPRPPRTTPEAILRQMGAYAAALGAIYPGPRDRDRDPLDPHARADADCPPSADRRAARAAMTRAHLDALPPNR